MATALKAFAAIFILFALSAVSWGEMYKWVDEQGTTHYGDKPPDDAEVQDITGRISSYDSPEMGKLPEDFFERDKKPSAKRVVMYSASWCGICKQAKSYFRSKSIAFTEYDIDTSAKGKKDFEKLGGKGVPIILVGNQRMNGFSPANFDALYSKN